jgi:DNA repair protein RadA/Sms
MAKARSQFICQNCGTVHTRWAGKCDSCGEWNTLVEEGTAGGIGSGPHALKSARKGRVVALTSLDGEIEDAPRIASGIAELDRVTGGGFVRGSASCSAATQASASRRCCCRRPPPSPRAATRRLHLRRGGGRAGQACARSAWVAGSAVELAAETNVEDILATLDEGRRRTCRHRFDPDAMDGDLEFRARAPSPRCARRRRR